MAKFYRESTLTGAKCEMRHGVKTFVQMSLRVLRIPYDPFVCFGSLHWAYCSNRADETFVGAGSTADRPPCTIENCRAHSSTVLRRIYGTKGNRCNLQKAAEDLLRVRSGCNVGSSSHLGYIILLQVPVLRTS